MFYYRSTVQYINFYYHTSACMAIWLYEDITTYNNSNTLVYTVGHKEKQCNIAEQPAIVFPNKFSNSINSTIKPKYPFLFKHVTILFTIPHHMQIALNPVSNF
jgi:hypothetical protein